MGTCERDETLLKDIPQGTLIRRTYSLEESNGHFSPFRYVPTPFSIPDLSNLWLPWAWQAALQEMSRHPIKAIYATGAPFSSHILAAFLKIKSGLPLVLDYRDEWTLDPVYRMYKSPHRRLLLPLERLQQCWVVRKADRVLVATASARRTFIERYGHAGKFHTIRNGYDAVDFDEFVEPNLPSNKFHVVYTGSTLPPVSRPEVFLRGVRHAIDLNGSLEADIRISFVGETDQDSRRLIRSLGLETCVKTVGYVSHPESVGYLRGADVLLLVVQSVASRVPGKVYEYIGSGKPVLVLTPRESEAFDLIDRAGLAFWADPEDELDIAKQLIRMHDCWKRRALTVNANEVFVHTLTRHNLTRRLAQILDEIAG